LDIIVKRSEAFPNWHLALEFLRRSSANFLWCDRFPEIEVEDEIKPQIVLQGGDGRGAFLVVPDEADPEQVIAICTALAVHRAQTDHPRLGSIRSSNFIKFLEEFAGVLAGKFELSEVAQVITEKTCDLFEADGASILWPTGDGNFRFAYLTTEDEEIRQRLENMVVPGDSGVAGWVARNRTTILVNDVNRDEVWNPDVDQRTQFKTRDILAAPIATSQDLIGVLQVVNKKHGKFKETDKRLIQLIAAIIAVFIDKARLYDRQLELARMQRELEIAHTLQRAIMPTLPSVIGPFRLDGESMQVSRVGGDFWDVLDLDGKEALLILGDVSGHGLSAALMMSSVRTASRTLLPHIKSPYALVDPLNLLIHKEFGAEGHYATLIFCHLDFEHHRIHYFRAGHEYPILRSSDGHMKMKRRGGLPMGLFPHRKDDAWYTHHLLPGEALFLYTDGVVDGLPCGDDDEVHLDDILEEHPDLGDLVVSNRFFSTMEERLGWQAAADDATFLRLTVERT